LKIHRRAYLEEEPDDEDLQASHTDHHQALNDAEIEDPSFRAPYCAEIPVLAGAEVLLISRDG
jgi:hypothetical protein